MSSPLIFTGSGEAELSHTPKPFTTPGRRVRLREPSTSPVFSLMNVTRADLGLTSGTATGRAPLTESNFMIDTRACALMNGTCATLKNQGKSVSVSFTSTMAAVHGGASTTVSSVGEDWPCQVRELITM